MKSKYDELLGDAAGRRALLAQHAIVNVTNLIARLLEQNSMSQKDLAERMGVTEGRVAQILDGTANLTVATIARVLGVFDCVLEVGCRSAYETAAKPVWHFHGESWQHTSPWNKVVGAIGRAPTGNTKQTAA